MKIFILCAGRPSKDGIVKKDVERCRMLAQRFHTEIGRAVFTVGDTSGALATASTLVSMGLGLRAVGEFAWRMNLGREVQVLNIERTSLSQILVLSKEEYMAARDHYVSTLHWGTVGDVVRPGPLVGSLVDTDERTVEFIDPDKHR